MVLSYIMLTYFVSANHSQILEKNFISWPPYIFLLTYGRLGSIFILPPKCRVMVPTSWMAPFTVYYGLDIKGPSNFHMCGRWLHHRVLYSLIDLSIGEFSSSCAVRNKGPVRGTAHWRRDLEKCVLFSGSSSTSLLTWAKQLFSALLLHHVISGMEPACQGMNPQEPWAK